MDQNSLKKNLKFCLFNVENLFLLFDQDLPKNYLKLEEPQWSKLSTSVYENKPLFKTVQLAQTLLETSADIIMLCEVGGLESLKNFNTYFLNNEYSPILIEGNSDRNIDVGFLIKKNSQFYFDLLTHKNRDIHLVYHHEKLSQKKNSYKFSRDCAELRLFTKDVEHPFMIILLTHLKSPLDPERIDPHGIDRRTAELKTTLEIYNELKTQFTQIPILLCGDFNGQASRHNTEPEFVDIYTQTDLLDVLEVAQVPLEKRLTFYQVKSGLRSEGRQIDYCFLSDLAQKKLKIESAKVLDFKDEFGSPLKKPETLEQKLALPSDHYPVFFELENCFE